VTFQRTGKARNESWTVVIPVKGTASAKSRLGGSADLALAIALDTVSAALGAARVVVVTSAAAAAPFDALDVLVSIDPGGGLNAAIADGVAAAGDGPVAVLLGDVPALRTAELAAALAAGLQHPLAFVPDADGEGTVLITALRAADHTPAFGPGSREAHRAAGYVELDVPADSGLRRDVDTPEHLAAIGSRLGPRTAALLAAQSVEPGDNHLPEAREGD
jgi:2-phospho-L-lactate guanylyltransferase